MISIWIRQGHRWLGIILTIAILLYPIEMALGKMPKLLVYAPLIPLALLLVSGLYLFFRPYFIKNRGRNRRSGAKARR